MNGHGKRGTPWQFPFVLMLIVVFHGHVTKASSVTFPVRPVDFYSTERSGNDHICSPVLRSLNESYRVPEADATVSNLSLAGDLLLHSSLELPWSKQTFDSKRSWETIRLDYAAASTTRTDSIKTWVRWPFFWSDRLVSALFKSSQARDSLMKLVGSSENPVKVVAGENDENEILITPRTVPELWRDGAGSRSFSFVLNVVRVGQSDFVLAVDSEDAEAAQFNPVQLHIYVLQVKSPASLTVLCRFVHSP